MKNMNGKQTEMKKALYFAAIAMLGFASCTVELEPSKDNGGKGTQITFRASQQGFGTKAEIGETLSGSTAINWQENDEIKVFDEYECGFPFTATGIDPNNPTECNFVGYTDEPSEEYIAISPYNSDASFWYDDSEITGVTLPANQKAVEGSFDPAAALMAARTVNTSMQLQFKNLVGYVKLKPAFDFKSIVLTAGNGEILAGEGSIDYSQEEPVFSINSETNSEITLSDGENTLAGGKAYYIAVPAVDLAAGWKVTINAADGKSFFREGGKPISFKKNVIINLGELNADNMEEINYLSFFSSEAQNFTLANSDWEGTGEFFYKVGNGEWSTVTLGSPIAFGGDNGVLKLRGKSEGGTALSYYNHLVIKFSGTSPVECHGDLRTLVDYETYQTVSTANACFANLFCDCKNLTVAPDLPATTLAPYAYYGMFSDCSSLTVAPELPATTLTYGCYQSMFSGCTSLTKAPSLPAPTLAISCYSNMFSGCTALTKVPSLPATTLESQCYIEMFSGCTGISKIYIGATSVPEPWALAGWLDNTTPGTIYCTPEFKAMESDLNDYDCLYGWTLAGSDNTPYLTFSSAGLQKFSFTNFNDFSFGSGEGFEYKVGNGDWIDIPISGVKGVKFGGETGNLMLRGKSSKGTHNGNGCYWNIGFSESSPVACTGDIRTLIDYDNYSTVSTSEARFCSLFEDCAVLTSAPQLPATSLGEYCYSSMFSGCTSLTAAPSLPAKTLAAGCYVSMFEGCTALSAAPSLPATTLAGSCYSSMFYGCCSLTEAPKLIAPVLVNECYSEMFCVCTSLEEIYLGATSGFELIGNEGDPLDYWLGDTETAGTVYCTQELLDAAQGSAAIARDVANTFGWTLEKWTE